MVSLQSISLPILRFYHSYLTYHFYLHQGTLKGYDKNVNIILEDSQERIFSTDSGTEIVELGVFVVRGDNICIVGEVDKDLDLKIDSDAIQGRAIKPLVH